MSKNKICIIGLGEIGTQIFFEMTKIIKQKNLPYYLEGVDIDDKKIDTIRKMGGFVTKKIPQNFDIYIISVYTMDSIKNVISNIILNPNTLIIIESTLEPGTSEELIKLYPNINLVLFPHRYNPNDEKHHVFNLNRIIGASNDVALTNAKHFYYLFMNKNLIHQFPLNIVELSKPLENAYRFIEIAIAEELKLLCKNKNIDFNILRQAMNTKWNINLKEALNGIGGSCLPKDCKFINNYFKGNSIFNTVIKIDTDYKKWKGLD